MLYGSLFLYWPWTGPSVWRIGRALDNQGIGFDFLQVQVIILLSTLSVPAVGRTQPPV
jgi:hypothetical protein